MTADDIKQLGAFQLRAAFPSFYFKTRFRGVELGSEVIEFAIITAYATTGEEWTDAQNTEANEQLREELETAGLLLGRMQGYSPSTGHAETGWAASVGFEVACDLGLKYKQDAIYYVRDGLLYVSFCDERRGKVEVGQFMPKFSVDSS